MKKSLSLLLSLAMVISMFAGTVFAAEEKSPAEKLQELGVIKGTLTGLDEEAEWKRQDVAILLSRLYGEEEAAKETTPGTSFTDLGNNPLYQSVITWAVNKELFKGQSETTFAPSASMTNNEFATVILRVLGQEQTDFAKNIDKAIELKLLPAGTDGSANAVRGVTYAAISSALDVEVDGKKLGTILKLAGYEITDLAVASASAVVAKTVKVDFNDDVATISHADVTVVDADGNTVPVEKVAVDGKTATITLTSDLSQKAYTVKIAKATSKAGSELANGSAEFTYAKGVPATVAFDTTTVAKSTSGIVKYTVKDANGVNITADYPVSAFTVESSNYAVVNGSLNPVGIGFSVVNLKLTENNEIATGNITVNVVEALSISITKAELSGNTSNTLNLVSGSIVTATPNVVVKDQNNVEVTASATLTYASSNPTVVAVVNNGSSANNITALQAGTSTITVTAKYDNKTVTSSFVVTVKPERKATSFSLDKNTVTVVNNSYKLPQTVTVTVLDQDGQPFKGGATVTLKHANTTNGNTFIDINNSGGVTSGVVTATTNSDGKASISVNAAGTNGTTNLTVSVSDISGSQTVNARAVAATTVSGYEVAVNGAKLDSKPNTADTTKAASTSITVDLYVKDTNGNRVEQIAGSAITVELASSTILENNNGVLTVASANAGKTAKETFKVAYNGVLLGTYNVEVVNTHQDTVAKVVQNKSSISVPAGTITLAGNNEAFTAYNAYGDVVAATVEYVSSANETVVSTSGTTLNAATVGTTVVTVKINGSFYQLTVVVTSNGAV